MNYFLDIYGTLPRAGPGSNELTRQAFEMIPALPDNPRILDLGCGPGMQTIELLKCCAGHVTALDFLPEMIDRTRTAANDAGVANRLDTIVQDMGEMTFEPESFDLIWSEGAIYNLGFEAGLRAVKKFLKPGGNVAVSEVVWLKSDPPPDAVEFWAAYPEIDSVAAKLDVIARVGYESVGHFVLPAGAWTDEYYDPMEKLVEQKAIEWRGIAEAEAVLAEARDEISVFRRFSDYYSYAFFVMRG